jgi:hypothetical protein
MALQPQPIRVQFTGGVDTQTDEKAVEPPALLDLENGVFSKTGRIAKRNGYDSLGALGDDGVALDGTKARALAVRDDELILLSTDGARSYRESTGTWSAATPVRSVVARETPLSRTGTEQTQADSASNKGITVTAWVDSRGGVWWSASETDGGKILIAPQQCADGSRPRVVAVGDSLHVYYVKGTTEIWVVVVSYLTINQTHDPIQLINDLNPTRIAYDACDAAFGTQSASFIAWTTPGNLYKVGTVHESGVLGSSSTSLPAPVAGATTDLVTLSVSADGISFVVGGCLATSNFVYVDVYVFIVTLLLATSAVLVTGGSGFVSNVVVLLVGQIIYAAAEYASVTTDADRDRRVAIIAYDANAVTETLLSTTLGACLASGFCVSPDGAPLIYLTHDVPFFSVYLLVALDGSVVARTSPITAFGRPDFGWLPRWSTSGNKRSIALTIKEQINADGQFGETKISRVEMDFENVDSWQTAQLGRGLYMAGACLQHYDGARWSEQGFHYAPDGTNGGISSIGLPPVGAGLTGTFLYRAYYEEIDALGEIHRGPVSVGTSVTVAAQQVALVIPTYRATSKKRVRVAVFRSLQGQEEPLYRVSSIDPAATGANGHIVSDSTADEVSFSDEMSDAVLATQEPLYTNGGIISNDPVAMSGDVIVSGKNRLFFTDPSDPNLVRYSQELDDGYGAELSPSLSLRVDAKGGRITGIGVLDDAAVIFKEHASYVFGGPGPLANPTADPSFAFTPPSLVTTDSGCASPRSIASTPIGITVKTNKGIQMLGRDRQIADIGAVVGDYDPQDVSRATLLTDQKEIVFLTSSGRTLLFDYQINAWSTWTNHEGLDACVVAGVYHYLRNDGRVFRASATYSDDGRHVPLRITTAWIKPVPYLQGWGRIWHAHFLGARMSSCTLRVRYGLDYEPTLSAPFDLDIDANDDLSVYGAGAYGDGDYGGSGYQTMQRRIHVGKRYQAVRFTVEDVEDDTVFGPAFELSELLITGGLIRDAKKLEPARSD